MEFRLVFLLIVCTGLINGAPFQQKKLDDPVVFHVETEDSTFKDVSIGNRNFVVSGAWSNTDPSSTMSVFDLTGEEKWSSEKNLIFTTSARNKDVIAALSYNPQSEETFVLVWDSESSEPLWVYQIEGVSRPAQKTSILLSDDGETLLACVLIVDKSKDTLFTRIYSVVEFETETPVINNYDFPNGSIPLTFDASSDGAVVTVLFGTPIGFNAVVLDLEHRSIRLSRILDNTYPEDPIACMSPDAKYVAFGAADVSVYAWNSIAKFYTLFQGLRLPGYIGGVCALSESYHLGLGWYRIKQNQNAIYFLKIDSLSVNIEWKYFNEDGKIGFLDRPTDMAITEDGSVLAMTSLGDTTGNVPNLLVFETTSNKPVYELKDASIAGSFYTVDVIASKDNIFVAAGGAHELNSNNQDEGGDLLFIEIPRNPPPPPPFVENR